MSQSRQSPIVKMAALGSMAIGLYFVLQGTHWVNERISELPVHGRLEAAAADSTPAVPADPRRSLHPLLVESSSKAAALPLTDPAPPVGAGFDAAFGKGDKPSASPEASVPSVAMPLRDFFRELAGRVQLQAVTATGAIIGGRYVEVGSPLPMYAYPDARTGAARVPKLSAVTRQGVVISDARGARTLRITLPD